MRILLLIVPLLTGCATWDYKADLVDGCSTRTGYCHWSGSPKGGAFPAPQTVNPPPESGVQGAVGLVQGVHQLVRASGH